MADDTKHSRYVFTWKIRNFFSCHVAYGDYIESPTFILDDSSVKNWTLWLYPRGHFVSSTREMILYLMRARPDTISETAVFHLRMEMVNTNGYIFMTTENKKCKIEQSCGHCFYLKTYGELCDWLKSCAEDTLIIRCILSRSDGEMHSTGSEAVTIIDVDRCIFKWDVSNTGCFDWSESVSAPRMAIPDFKIVVSAPDEDVHINVQVLDESSLPVSLVFRLTFLSESGIRLATKCEIHLFDSLNSWQLPAFIRKKDLCFGKVSPPCFKYTFICECDVSRKSYSCEQHTFNSSIKSDLTLKYSFSSLQEDFRELFMNKKFSDVTLKVGSKDFLAHKAVLGARSPVFSTLFDQDMIENKTGVVHISDIEEETMQNLLEYMYTDNLIEMNYESALELLIAADKYQVVTLIEECTSAIMSMLCVENVCEVISVADMINWQSLKTYALNYIMDNVSEVVSTPIFLEWSLKQARLASEIFCKLSERLRGY